MCLETLICKGQKMRRLGINPNPLVFNLARRRGLTTDGGTKVTDNKLTDLDNISNIPIVNEPATNTPEIIDDGNQDNASGTEAIASTTPDVGPIVISPEVPTSTIAHAILIDTDKNN